MQALRHLFLVLFVSQSFIVLTFAIPPKTQDAQKWQNLQCEQLGDYCDQLWLEILAVANNGNSNCEVPDKIYCVENSTRPQPISIEKHSSGKFYRIKGPVYQTLGGKGAEKTLIAFYQISTAKTVFSFKAVA